MIAVTFAVYGRQPMSRTKSKIALAAVGLVLVIGAILVKWVAAPALVKIPTDLKARTTKATGTGQYLNTSTGQQQQGAFTAKRIVTGDKSAGTSKVAVWDVTLCLVDSKVAKPDAFGCVKQGQPGYLDEKHTDRIAIDRKSAEAVNDPQFKTAVEGKSNVRHEGVAYTFPLNTKKRTYRMWDAIAQQAADAKFEGTDKIHGLTVYKFESQVPGTQVTVQKIIQAKYTSDTTVYVEPKTGVIVKGLQHIAYTALGQTALETTLTFDDHTIKSQADFAKSQRTKIALIQLWIPLILLVVGVVLLLVAVGTAARRREAAEPEIAGAV